MPLPHPTMAVPPTAPVVALAHTTSAASGTAVPNSATAQPPFARGPNSETTALPPSGIRDVSVIEFPVETAPDMMVTAVNAELAVQAAAETFVDLEMGPADGETGATVNSPMAPKPNTSSLSAARNVLAATAKKIVRIDVKPPRAATTIMSPITMCFERMLGAGTFRDTAA